MRNPLGNVRLCGAALDCALLLVSDDPRLFQVIGEERGTTHELAMVPGVLGTCPNEVRDRAAAGEQDIGHLRIAAINDNGGAQIGIGALIFLNYRGDINAPRTVSELGRKGYLIATPEPENTMVPFSIETAGRLSREVVVKGSVKKMKFPIPPGIGLLVSTTRINVNEIGSACPTAGMLSSRPITAAHHQSLTKLTYTLLLTGICDLDPSARSLALLNTPRDAPRAPSAVRKAAPC
jgi:hypothetical protein